jgi:hypothetical protein
VRERLINRRRQGDLGEASAIEWLASKGALVFFPLGHSSDVDLIAELDGRLLRIQVKTTTYRHETPNGHPRWSVALATNGGNQSWSGQAKRFDPEKVDLLFALAGDGRRWLIPSSCLDARNAVTLGGTKYSEFEIELGSPILALVYGDEKPLSKIDPLPGEYPSGQRMAAVNRPAKPSQVRILSPPSQALTGEATIWQKRRVTLPRATFDGAGLAVGDRLRFRADGPGRIVLERIEPPSNTLAGGDATLFD